MAGFGISTTVLCLCAMFGLLNGSAIPMWEFLSKQEKMSYLYSMFASQVETFCETSDLKNCNSALLKYGLNKLKTLSEEEMDSLDPYQRGASNMIWETMMDGHPLEFTTPKPQTSSPTSTAKPNSYDDSSFGEEFGETGSESARIDNVYVLPPPKDFILKYQSGNPQYVYPKNHVVGYINTITKPEKPSVFTRFQQQYRPVEVSTEGILKVQDGAPAVEDGASRMDVDASRMDEDASRFPDDASRLQDDASRVQNGASRFQDDVPLTGPMVIRVYPDGTPVREATQAPFDEDLRQYKLAKIKLPNL